MSTRFHARYAYAAAQARLVELYSDPAFHEQRARWLGATRVQCIRHTEMEGMVVLSVRSHRPATWAPRGEDRSTFTLRIEPTTGLGSWDRVAHGFEDLARARGRTRIMPGAEGESVVEVEGELDIRIPLLGGRIERRIVAGLDADSRREAELVCARLGLVPRSVHL